MSLGCACCNELVSGPLPPWSCSPAAVALQAQQTSRCWNVHGECFFLRYSWKGAAWLGGISLLAFETGRKFMVCCKVAAVSLLWWLVWFVATIFHCLLEKTEILGRAVNFVPHKDTGCNCLKCAHPFQHFRKAPPGLVQGGRYFVIDLGFWILFSLD